MGVGFPFATIAGAGFDLYRARKAGVLGLEEWSIALLRVVPKIYVYMDLKHRTAVNEMVGEAKGNVPQDTGRLLGGITGRVEDGTAIFEAQAVHDGDDEDYARFVEFGTRESGLANDDYFTGDGASALGHHHGATPAEPFFWPAARDQIEKHGGDMADALASASQDEGFA